MQFNAAYLISTNHYFLHQNNWRIDFLYKQEFKERLNYSMFQGKKKQTKKTQNEPIMCPWKFREVQNRDENKALYDLSFCMWSYLIFDLLSLEIKTLEKETKTSRLQSQKSKIVQW